MTKIKSKNSNVVQIIPDEPDVTMYVYFKNGNVYKYVVKGQWKAREHAEKIMANGFRGRVGSRLEWFGTHYLDKVCWDAEYTDYLMNKYE